MKGGGSNPLNHSLDPALPSHSGGREGGRGGGREGGWVGGGGPREEGERGSPSIGGMKPELMQPLMFPTGQQKTSSLLFRQTMPV